MSGHVLTIHGVAPAASPHSFCCRNMCDTDAMVRYLTSVPPFVPLVDAIAGRGNALTIDDAIRGAADAALLARRHGHAVTLFVNPGQVESREPYAFLVLNVVLDGLSNRVCMFEGTAFATVTYAERQFLRRRIKARLCAMTDEQMRLEFVTCLAGEWGVTVRDVPPHFRTLSRDELVNLRDAGVQLENHGWLHNDHTSLSSAESVREIRDGRAWLQRELGVEAAYFAAPFGEALPTPEASDACKMWFAVSAALPAGRLSSQVFNREVLELSSPGGGSTGRVRAIVRKLLNFSLVRLSGRLSP